MISILLITTSITLPADKAAAIAYAVENGFPPLGLWNMPQFTPNLIRAFVDKEKLVNGFAMQYLSPMDRQVIYCVISAANNCEMCLSFHAAGLLQSKYITPSDLTLMIHGGLPTDEQLRPIAVAAKYCHSHKGILLEREQIVSKIGCLKRF